MFGSARLACAAALTPLLLAGVAGCTGSASADGDTDALGWITPAKKISVPLPEGAPLTGTAEADAPGKDELVLVNFWASTCTPCRKEMPLLDEVDAEPGVRVVGVSRDQFAKYAKEFVAETEAGFPSWHDPDGEYLGEFAGVVQLSTLPNTALVKDGRVVAVHVGEMTSKAEVDAGLDRFR